MKTQLTGLFLLSFTILTAQIPNRFNPSIQENYKIQYFAPAEDKYFAGDPIPFYHNGTFHVFWLLDTAHHALGQGGHQWAHCSSTDLVHWTHYPLALPINRANEKSLGPGSLYFKDGEYYLFYTTRESGIPDKIEYISYATSKDGIYYDKQGTGPFLLPSKEYSPRDYRDPHVFYDEASKKYFMLVTVSLASYQYKQQEGRQVYYTSDGDLKKWNFKGDFYVPGDAVGFSIPECPTLFKWGEWYYLMYKVSGGSFYRMAKTPTGPWTAPVEDNIGSDYALVYKVSEFNNGRRIAVGMAPSRTGNKDDGIWAYAGNLVFRELFQNSDGTLYSSFVKEMMPDEKITIKIDNVPVNSDNGFQAFKTDEVAENAHIRMTIEPQNDYEQAGLMLRFSEKGNYELRFSHRQRSVTLGNQTIYGVYGLDKSFTIDIIMKNDIIDVSIEGKRCILNRCPEQKGSKLIFFARNGKVLFKNITIGVIK